MMFPDGLSGLGDGKTLDLIDTTGVAFAALKALDRKVKRLERDVGFNLAEPSDRSAGFRLAA